MPADDHPVSRTSRAVSNGAGPDGQPAADALEIIARASGTTTTLVLSGEFDLAATGAVRSAIDDALGNGSARLVVDLRGVTFIDSSGMTLLIRANRRAVETGTSLVLLPCQEPAQKALRLCGLDEELPFAPGP